jgi:glycosyltransferase involved in cell wall biosynthesis
LLDIRRFGLAQPVAVIPNGVSQNGVAPGPSPLDAGLRDRGFEGRRIALFLSRITPIKGLPLLVGAVARVRAAVKDWIFVIAGPDEFGHKKEIQQLIHEEKLEQLFYFAGPMFGSEKRAALAKAQLFLLPTLSEGAPLSILEALGAGVPVLTTVGSNWTTSRIRGFGWSVDISIEAIAGALRTACSLSPEALKSMGNCGSALVHEEYSWRILADDCAQVYSWLLGRRDRPSRVHL